MDGVNKDLHCCFVIQAVPPYHYDLNQILALPSGFRYHNRYNEQWVDVNLHNVIGQLAGMRLLLIMRDRDRNRLVPARWATIDVAQPVGDIFYFEYRLGALISYSRDAMRREEEILRCTEILHGHHAELPGAVSADLITPSVFLSAAGSKLPTAPADDLGHWGNVVAAVASAAIYEKVDFLKIVDLRTGDRRQAEMAGEGYAVAPNTVYTLRVFQTMPNFGDGIVTPHDIMLNTFADHVASLRARQRAVGKYDMLTFDMKVLDLAANERTSIDVAHEAGYGPGVWASSSIYIPLIIRPRRSVLSVLVLRTVVAISALLLVFTPGLIPADPQIVRNVANVAFVLAVAGVGRTLQAIWPALPWR